MTNEQAGYTGEWIVRVKGIAGPHDAAYIHDSISRIIGLDRALEDRETEVIFDESRWQGGDF